jgi:hypothetical protein
LDGIVHLLDFAEGQFFATGADRSVVSQASEEDLDFDERKAHIAGKADQEDAVQCIGGIVALAADAVW